MRKFGAMLVGLVMMFAVGSVAMAGEPNVDKAMDAALESVLLAPNAKVTLGVGLGAYMDAKAVGSAVRYGLSESIAVSATAAMGMGDEAKVDDKQVYRVGLGVSFAW